MLVFPLGCSQTKPTPQPCFHPVSHSIIRVCSIQEKTLQYDAICMLVWGLLVITWLGGKSPHIPKCHSLTGGNLLSIYIEPRYSSKIAECMFFSGWCLNLQSKMAQTCFTPSHLVLLITKKAYLSSNGRPSFLRSFSTWKWKKNTFQSIWSKHLTATH